LARPRRVEAVIARDPGAQPGRVLQALRALPHRPWWPPLNELLSTARHFFAGSLGGAAERPQPAPGRRLPRVPDQENPQRGTNHARNQRH